MIAGGIAIEPESKPDVRQQPKCNAGSCVDKGFTAVETADHPSEREADDKALIDPRIEHASERYRPNGAAKCHGEQTKPNPRVVHAKSMQRHKDSRSRRHEQSAAEDEARICIATAEQDSEIACEDKHTQKRHDERQIALEADRKSVV